MKASRSTICYRETNGVATRTPFLCAPGIIAHSLTCPANTHGKCGDLRSPKAASRSMSATVRTKNS
jgi:hypothetical protein